jgi:hypothetical protein
MEDYGQSTMKNILKLTLLFLITSSISQINLEAATIILRSGLTVKGKLIDRSEEEISIQDPDSRQIRIIKTVFIRDLVLEPEEQKVKEKKKTGRDIKLLGTESEEAGILSIIQPTIGLMPGVAYPFGKLGKNLTLGYGANLFCDVGIPMKPEVFKVRPGLSVGFLYHQTKSSDYASSLMMLPITVYMKFQFITPVGVRPYIKIGGGITPVTSSGGNSFDPTVTAAVGLGYINDRIPFMEFFFEAGMMMAFEKQRGDFITANIGVAYRFGSPPATAATLKTDVKKK